ncbi:hypothetical protein C7C46_08945 [Streptomyces tateyamensis]|uniref:Uncharacterized protein n=1 Tax=Streptomyces tateyamensis TaxID=565073 RepID=A0A2V4NE73_9ACTN|nr:hypothetical protein [Streptomyces tateyamensis]PYC83449.1 hypothetical protein C7C46_08945 [Streptomyces tateyamensis]
MSTPPQTGPPLAQVADLQTAMQRPVDAAQAALAIRRASARVRKWTRQTFTFVQQETIVVDGGDRILRVPDRPLVVDANNPLGVVELADLGGVQLTLVEQRDYIRNGDELTRGYPWYAPGRLMGWPRRNLGIWAPRVQLTYSHGYATVPDDVMDVVLDLASMNLTNPQNLRQEAIDDYSRTFASETIGNAQLTDAHKEELASYRVNLASVRPT